jgi:hypothetical protein
MTTLVSGTPSRIGTVLTYRWNLDDDRVLTFEPIAPDECPGRAVALEDVSYVFLFPPT